jgi:hypothetical protein
MRNTPGPETRKKNWMLLTAKKAITTMTTGYLILPFGSIKTL